MIRDGTARRGGKLTDAQVLEIRAFADKTHKEIAEIYNVNRSLIGFIIRRDVWKHI
jgi:hypothetical protein